MLETLERAWRKVEGLPARAGKWMRGFTPDFWRFFAAAFFFDFGFGLFFFLFNLYLTDLHFNERLIGQVMASLTLGNVVGSIPAIGLVRRFGIRKALLFSFIAAPLCCGARVVFLQPAAQLGLAFVTGLALCCWPICFSPALARFTDEKNRATGFSIVFATGIGMGCLAGMASGYLAHLLQVRGAGLSLVTGIRDILLLSCGIAMLGISPLCHLRQDTRPPGPSRGTRIFHPFLLRFLPPFLLWSVVTGSFATFGAIYLQKVLGLPLSSVGAVFSLSQLLQFAAVLSTPLLYRRLGTIRGVSSAQILTALFLLLLCSTHSTGISVVLFLAFNGTQWMCSPGIYRYLTDHVPQEELGTASAVQNISSALCQAGTAAVTGACIVRFGYSAVMVANAAFALVAAGLFLLMPRWSETRVTYQIPGRAAPEVSL